MMSHLVITLDAFGNELKMPGRRISKLDNKKYQHRQNKYDVMTTLFIAKEGSGTIRHLGSTMFKILIN